MEVEIEDLARRTYLALPVSLIRAAFEFPLPIAVGVYAIMGLV